MNRQMNNKLVEVIEKNNIHPVVARNFEWKASREAFESVLHGKEVGKIVIIGPSVRI